jgi:hypothetical protein
MLLQNRGVERIRWEVLASDSDGDKDREVMCDSEHILRLSDDTF